MAKLVCGVGVNNRKYLANTGGKPTKEYDLWKSLLTRCYCPKYQKRQSTYVGCSVSENFRNFSFFHEWAEQQIGFGQKGFQLDKDLLLKGNKVYSETACLFLPKDLNNLLISSRASRGKLPIGVSAQGSGFQAEVHCGKSSVYLGFFNTSERAFVAYKQAKEAYIKLQAQKWKAHIDPRAFAALMAYTVQITD